MDPNTLNLDPDPEFWHNFAPDLDTGKFYQFLREKKIIENNSKEKQLS